MTLQWALWIPQAGTDARQLVFNRDQQLLPGLTGWHLVHELQGLAAAASTPGEATAVGCSYTRLFEVRPAAAGVLQGKLPGKRCRLAIVPDATQVCCDSAAAGPAATSSQCRALVTLCAPTWLR